MTSSSNFHIRTVTPSDNADLARIIRAVFEEHKAPTEGTVYTDPTTDDLHGLFRKEGATLYVGEVDGSIVGCGGTDGCVEFVKFYLAPEGRGLGLGLAIMQKSQELAKSNGITQIYLESLPHYAKAVKMYEKQGYTMLDKPMGCSGHTGCNIWMVKNL